MKTKNKRLMIIKYTKKDLVDRLHTCLDMCCIPHVIIKEYELVNGDTLYIIFIDKGSCTWNQVMKEVNRVQAVKFRYTNEHYIENGMLCTDCGTIYI